MKQIQWYPGHMAKAMRMMGENLTYCDAALYVLDARAPAATYNQKLTQLLGTKPVLFVMNKSDLSGGKAESLAALMRQRGKHVVMMSALNASSARVLQAEMQSLVRERAQRNLERGAAKPLRFMVAGVPNTGKSAVINLMCGARRAVTGDRAGVTRAKQWVKCGAFELLDTPGAMPPACENQMLAMRLAFLGSINDDILEWDEVALALLAELSEKYPAGLKERYGIEGGAPLEMLDQVCLRRGFLLGKNELDYDRAERAVVDDFRKCRLGKVCLDSAEDLESAGLI